MVWYVSPAFFPSILLLLFTLLTRSKSIPTLLTLLIIPPSLYKRFFHNQSIIFIHLTTLLAGYLIIHQLQL
ncbi:DUF2198 family protein, partial [Staphylococcus epidermidis]|uniref:DUF2198 family protein n=1 Tax=Staphylococcus epidermidis TaxID=1282 RepID=UPI0011A90B2F